MKKIPNKVNTLFVVGIFALATDANAQCLKSTQSEIIGLKMNSVELIQATVVDAEIKNQRIRTVPETRESVVIRQPKLQYPTLTETRLNTVVRSEPKLINHRLKEASTGENRPTECR